MNKQSVHQTQKPTNSTVSFANNILQRKNINRNKFATPTIDIQSQSESRVGSEFNTGVGFDFSKVPIQAKLKIGQPNDKYEQEADRVAEQVMRMPHPRLSSAVGSSSLANNTVSPSGMIQRACASCEEQNKMIKDENSFTREDELIQAKQITPLIQRQEDLEEEPDEELIQTKTIGGRTPKVSPAISSNIQSLQSGGQPLSRTERDFFEPRFGADFSKVRVHSDTKAVNAAQSVNARAFTLGHNVVFGAGEYSPDSVAGRKLFAHELTHVVQQNGKYTNGNSMSKQHFLYDPPFAIQRKELFSSTMKICHRILKSRTFKVSQGSVSVIADAEWIGPGTKQCGASVYPMTLAEEGIIFDSERESCDFRVNRADIQTWTNVPTGDYHLTIWPNNTNPNCCLNGTIKVLEQSGVKGPSCGGRAKNEKALLDVLHLALDGAGMFPALGVIPDAVNATIYLIEGDWTNAGISAGAMVPIFGQGVTATKLGVKVTAKAVERLGKEGIEQGLKKAAQKEAAERAAKKAAKEKAGKEGTEKVGKGKADKGKKEKKKGNKGKWGCQDVRCNVYPDRSQKPPKTDCPKRVIGATPYIHPSYSVACKAAQVAANLMVPKGCIKRHCNCKTKCTKK